MSFWRRIGVNKALFLCNIAFLLYQYHTHNSWLREQTRAIEAIQLPECPKPETIIVERKVTLKETPAPSTQLLPVPVPRTAEGATWEKWDYNWDGREASAGAVIKSRATRYIYIVRHGQYFGYGPDEGHLSPLGKQQIATVGTYLKSLNFTWHRFVASTSVRAAESADILQNYLPSTVHRENSHFLKEGWPTFPEPPFPGWNNQHPSFAADGPRISRAFERYIHRAEPSQSEDSNELIVAHGNVIAYFTLRALQLPPERWLKISVLQGSITLMMIGPDGHVTIKYLGDIGFMPKKDWSG